MLKLCLNIQQESAFLSEQSGTRCFWFSCFDIFLALFCQNNFPAFLHWNMQMYSCNIKTFLLCIFESELSNAFTYKIVLSIQDWAFANKHESRDFLENFKFFLFLVQERTDYIQKTNPRLKTSESIKMI